MGKSTPSNLSTSTTKKISPSSPNTLPKCLYPPSYSHPGPILYAQSQSKQFQKSHNKKPVLRISKEVLANNEVFPAVLDREVFRRLEDGKGRKGVRVSTWNVNGIRAAARKGLRQYLKAENADIVILTETKGGDPNIGEINRRYPYRYFGNPVKGQYGIGILSKIEPDRIYFGLPGHPGDQSGRIIVLEFPDTFIIGTYVPNIMGGSERKALWNHHFEPYLRDLDRRKPVIWGGDLNICPSAKDTPDWERKSRRSNGCTKEEIKAFESQLNPSIESGDEKLLDIWRELHPDLDGHYTQFNKRNNRRRGDGWRYDYMICSERIFDRVKQCEIRYDCYGASDHLPVMLDIAGPL